MQTADKRLHGPSRGTIARILVNAGNTQTQIDRGRGTTNIVRDRTGAARIAEMRDALDDRG